MPVQWPESLPKPSMIHPRTTKQRYKSGFEAGYTQINNKFTKSKMAFDLEWGSNSEHHVLHSQDKDTLLDFFENNAGNIIEWEDPRTENIFNVVFADDELSFSEIKPGSNIYSCSLTLEEV